MKSCKLLCLAAFALGGIEANADLVLYSSSFGGAGGTDLNGTAVTTSGATGAQHTSMRAAMVESGGITARRCHRLLASAKKCRTRLTAPIPAE